MYTYDARSGACMHARRPVRPRRISTHRTVPGDFRGPPWNLHTVQKPAPPRTQLTDPAHGSSSLFHAQQIRVKCDPDDTVGDLKKMVAAQTGTRPESIRIQKWNQIFKDHITLGDYEINDGMSLELYYN